MANEQSMPLPLVDERNRKMLDAIHNAPCMSLQIVLFSLYAEGDDNLKTRIEDLVHDYTLTLHNLNAGIATPASELRTEPATEVPLAREEPIDNTIYCPVCGDYFDPDDEDDLCFHHPGKRIAIPGFDSVAYEKEVSPEAYEFKVEEGLDTEENRLVPVWASTWDCCGGAGASRGCVQNVHVEYVEGMEDWDDSDSYSDESGND
ncbi:hypothetical protein GE21DRAFT_3840 [Neurospora crassa]|uniref:C2H2-type domain-containing protein n=1 Tax=Neurospora crassa (strain ATCC 24698 / 74-OR23-1A / CBS 708.71 / DSM 1257 / FGSC 987) TaxID=367110 RepID=Q7S335_NEUCR|nr:hypothetical protein NCU09180 [Neurospora crassa OR74A]EAA29854.1 hypothetical protein NCU09180 [Neurospora crassa OR74A]KHE84339.1 hypothetical protein GE21DRAFT_3840 [Neurospora crassa]|eukprot:XP_959090.1 hypothetical protein NCU09180 [Neurospora crassa OR74A]